MSQRTHDRRDSGGITAEDRPAAAHSRRGTFAAILTLGLVGSVVLLVRVDRSLFRVSTPAGQNAGTSRPPVVPAIPQDRATAAQQPAAAAPVVDATPAGSRSPRAGLRTPDPAIAAMSADHLTTRLIGRWSCEVYGRQTIDNHPDGQAQLTAELDLVASFLYGDRLTMQLAWNVADGVLTHELKSGEPRENVEKLIRDRGSHRSYLILELNEQRMLLQDVDRPEIVRTWTRLP
jgi:hypothetical protein